MLALILAAAAVALAQEPSVPLYNAAVPGTMMPIVGVGTGAYGGPYWNDTGVALAMSTWLRSGGRRIDTSYTYNDQSFIANGIALSGVPRRDIFITSKVGPSDPLGFNDTIFQFEEVLRSLNTTYVDLLLVHWPGNMTNTSSDPACTGPRATPRACRQSTWKAMELIFNAGGAKAIGVSNFEVNHLQDIYDMKSLLPSVNQVEYHPYWHEDDLVKHCQANKIVFNSYSPVGARDVSPARCGWDLLTDPGLATIAAAHNRSPAQIVLRWNVQQGIVVNPRTKNATHMDENRHVFDFTLTDAEMSAIASLKAPSANSKVCADPNYIP